MIAQQVANCDSYFRDWRRRVNKRLFKHIPAPTRSEQIIESAMHYAVEAGHRWRPLLLITSFEAVGGKTGEDVLDLACAIELIHCCTIILDDLPFVDNADLRRDRPTCHLLHGEAVTVYASHLLYDTAKRLASQNASEIGIDSQAIERHLDDLKERLIQGQLMELRLKHSVPTVDLRALRLLYELKGSLFTSAIWLGVKFARLDELKATNLCNYGQALGAAYQIADDIADRTGHARLLGKAVAMDTEKVNLVTFSGVREAQRVLKAYWTEGLKCLRAFPYGTGLMEELGMRVLAFNNQSHRSPH